MRARAASSREPRRSGSPRAAGPARPAARRAAGAGAAGSEASTTDVLVAFASRHGGTEGLARAIGEKLSASGLSVDVLPMDEVDSLDPYAACVLGSAVYMGRWLPGARAFVQVYADAIATRPTWLFSSGPVGESPAGGASGLEASELVAVTHARDHHLFGGRLDARRLSWPERLVARIVHVPFGDYRDWAAAENWAAAISRTLAGGAV